MGIVGIWSIPTDQQTVAVDSDGNPLDDPPVPLVTGYQDEDSGTGYGSWLAAQRATPGFTEPEPQGGTLDAQPGVVQPQVADENLHTDF